MRKILVIDIGGSSIKHATFTKDGVLENKGSFSVPTTFKCLQREIEKLFKLDDYCGISISSPGAIDTKTGQGYGISAIDYIPCGGNLKQELETSLGVPVAIDNDANCAALSEVHFSEGLANVAYIVLGSGVGGAVIIDGQVVSGSTFFGGEFGYVPYKEGSYSSYAGMNGLSLRATGNKEITTPGIEIFEKYEQGIESYVYAVDEYYKAIAHLLSILKYTINPDAVIFAGAITARKQFLDELNIRNELLCEGIEIDLSDVDIRISKFTGDANLYGAYANLVRNYKLEK